MSVALDEVEEFLREMEAMKADKEAAHVHEDTFYRLLLRGIADGKIEGEEARQCCRRALESGSILVERWYA